MPLDVAGAAVSQRSIKAVPRRRQPGPLYVICCKDIRRAVPSWQERGARGVARIKRGSRRRQVHQRYDARGSSVSTDGMST